MDLWLVAVVVAYPVPAVAVSMLTAAVNLAQLMVFPHVQPKWLLK
jgi:hypothetical protein